ncbi:hypothetical protein CF327_g1924 [Tilletia walkeri]|uniref:Sulfhydryl oxidase n=1 Tax=Tilletia walkeri TaxID=117179 RepID=A0A8X7T4Q5_9BASI|nr:hypothetical protein CF327_g1924 [Tilletia walkeri]KAE8268063.1 hypothetical protein A4X09_0g4269 [Tilletia walkeri]
MPTFSSKPRRGGSGFLARVSPRISRNPILFFGLPFIFTITASSFVLAQFTQTRYDYNATKVQTLSKEEELRMSKDRRKIDVREEYFRLTSDKTDDDWDQWEPVRVPRPEGTPEWGVAPGADADSLPPRSRGWFGWLRPKKVELEGLSAEGQRREERQRIPRSGATKDGDDEEKKTSPLAPGVVLGPDGKPCRACNSKLAFAAAMKGTTGLPKSKATPATTSAEGTSSNSSKSSSSTSAAQIEECPPDVEALGHATWTLLHSAAAYYPSDPSPAQQTSMRNFLQALPDVYPCSSCAEALREEYAREKREGRGWEGREGVTLEQAVRGGDGRLSIWLCGLHNEVNARLGKPLFDCTAERLRQRWRDGPSDGRCD